jgi:hypothetical protein
LNPSRWCSLLVASCICPRSVFRVHFARVASSRGAWTDTPVNTVFPQVWMLLNSPFIIILSFSFMCLMQLIQRRQTSESSR